MIFSHAYVIPDPATPSLRLPMTLGFLYHAAMRPSLNNTYKVNIQAADDLVLLCDMGTVIMHHWLTAVIKEVEDDFVSRSYYRESVIVEWHLQCQCFGLLIISFHFYRVGTWLYSNNSYRVNIDVVDGLFPVCQVEAGLSCAFLNYVFMTILQKTHPTFLYFSCYFEHIYIIFSKTSALTEFSFKLILWLYTSNHLKMWKFKV